MNNPVISNKHKVVLVYLSEIENVGDLILGDSVEWLIKRRRQDIELVPLNLIPSKKELLPKFYFNRLVSRILMSISKRVPFKDFGNMLFYFACKIMVEKYIDNKLKRGGVKAIVYAVGMLKFSTQNFSSFFYILNKIANKYNIPVMINAVSIERGDVFDWRFRKLASSLHFKNVRVITIRDGEREALILKKDYISEFNIENRIRIGLVGDPALWVREVYQYYDKPRKKGLKKEVF